MTSKQVEREHVKQLIHSPVRLRIANGVTRIIGDDPSKAVALATSLLEALGQAGIAVAVREWLEPWHPEPPRELVTAIVRDWAENSGSEVKSWSLIRDPHAYMESVGLAFAAVHWQSAVRPRESTGGYPAQPTPPLRQVEEPNRVGPRDRLPAPPGPERLPTAHRPSMTSPDRLVSQPSPSSPLDQGLPGHLQASAPGAAPTVPPHPPARLPTPSSVGKETSAVAPVRILLWATLGAALELQVVPDPETAQPRSAPLDASRFLAKASEAREPDLVVLESRRALEAAVRAILRVLVGPAPTGQFQTLVDEIQTAGIPVGTCSELRRVYAVCSRAIHLGSVSSMLAAVVLRDSVRAVDRAVAPFRA